MEACEDDLTLYISGRAKASKKRMLCVLTPTRRGWRCRSTLGDQMNHDYESKETLDELRSWAFVDLVHGAVMTTNRAEASGLLSRMLEQTDSCKHDLLLVPAGYDPNAWAERVLQHLQHGW